MNLKIIYDSPPCADGFVGGWGFSCLLGGKLLFDTGDNFQSLDNNLRQSGVKPGDIEEVFISHEHADHAGGLEGFLEFYGAGKVHIPAGISFGFKKMVAARAAAEEYPRGASMGGGLFSTGAVSFVYKGARLAEHSLVARTGAGLAVITGCAHTGAADIVRGVKENFPGERIALLAGGFHLRDSGPEEIAAAARQLRSLGVERVAPCHCTGAAASAYFSGVYGPGCLKVFPGFSGEI